MLTTKNILNASSIFKTNWRISIAIVCYLMTSLSCCFASEKFSRSDILQKSYDIEFVEGLKKEAIDHFTLLGKPITPVVFQRIEQWLSDMMPGVIAIDLLSTIDSNQFCGKLTTQKDESFFRHFSWHSVHNETDSTLHEYAFLGKIGDDKTVFAVRSNDGGSLTNLDLIILKIELEKCWEITSKPRYRLLAKQIAYINFTTSIAPDGLDALGDELLGIQDNSLIFKNERTNKITTIDLKGIALEK
jgi:hypothetical protein